MKLTSDAFRQGDAIPARFTCDADDISPPLAWRAVPEATQSFALVCDDPDAPMGTWVHWVYYDIPAGTSSLPAGVPVMADPDSGGTQGRNDFGQLGYGGPCPPGGTHRYFFRLYAVDCVLSLDPGATRQDLQNTLEGHVLAEAELMGTYRRR